MSVQFGRWSFGGQPAAPGYLEKAVELLAPYGPDGGGRYAGPGVDIIYRGFYTTRESRREQQPHQLPSGAVLTWDGRLDNREELLRQLGPKVTLESPDVEIAGAAYAQWGTKSFAKLIGDWALSAWNPRDHKLILAKDFLGARHLYYAADQEQVTWSTILDPLVLLAGKTFQLEEEYIGGWLAFFPAAHLTPYVGIHAVPPSTFVCLRPGRETATRYWDFDPHKQIRYASDSEYEEHFRSVFGESVRRRLRADAPVLAELSGGMDSSSIVCMADRLIAQGKAETPRLDTLSYYDDSEPNWNERPYIANIEDGRGRAGCRIDISSFRPFARGIWEGRFPASPSSLESSAADHLLLSERLALQENRTVLSGIGGDELTGGVPSPTPELADLLAKGKLTIFAHQLKVWALEKRIPWLHLLREVIGEFIPAFHANLLEYAHRISWLTREFASNFRRVRLRFASRSKLLGPPPSFQQAVKTLDLLRGQLGCCSLSGDPTYEKCYPYLDRDFAEFALAVPREQMVRPGQRRSLMRRALAGIVPGEILNRRRKAFVIRGPLADISTEWQQLTNLCSDMRSESLGFVCSSALLSALKTASIGRIVPLVPLLRTVAFEHWLRAIEHWNCINSRASRESTSTRVCSGLKRSGLKTAQDRILS